VRLLKRVEYEAVYGAVNAARALSLQFSSARSKRFRRGRRAGNSMRRPPQSEAEGPGRASRFGISVKKALGGAVVRNRIRRRIREILRRNRTEIPTGWDIVIHPRRSVAQAPFAPLEAELVRLLRRQNAGRASRRERHELRGARVLLWPCASTKVFFRI
jgi:ribonuclease P protein component